MPKLKIALVVLLLVVSLQQGAAASIQYFGFYFVHERIYGHAYLPEVQGNTNIINWVFDAPTLQTTDFAQRLTQAPKTKLMLTLGLSTTTACESGINVQVFTNHAARECFLQYVKTQLQSTSPPILDSVVYLSLNEEWFTLMYQGYFNTGIDQQGRQGLAWGLFDGHSPWEQRELMKNYLQTFITHVKAVFPDIPVLLVDGWWSTSPWNLNHAPSNVDVLGLDAYFMKTSELCDATQRSRFDADVTAAYNDAAAYGKPFVMVGNAAQWANGMPSPCQMQWFKDLADSRGDVQAMLWWLWASSDGILGVREPQFAAQKTKLFQIGQGIIQNNVVVQIDAPLPESVVAPGTLAGGWTIDRSALHTSGVDAIHVWAYPDPLGSAPPVFLTATSTAGDRPDVGAAVGAQFRYSGFSFLLPANTPTGGFTMVIYAHSTETGGFTNWGVRHLYR